MPPAASPTTATITLRTERDRRPSRRGEPVRIGIPLPRGLANDPGVCQICDQEGHAVDVQWRVLERWPDGSLRWVLADWKADSNAGEPSQYQLRIGDVVTARALASGIAIDDRGGSLTVATGAATFRLAIGGVFPFADVVADGTSVLAPAASGLVVTDAAGTPRPCVVTGLTVEAAGPLHAVVRVEGRAAGTEPLEITLRAEFFAGLPTVRLSLTLRNPRRASHPGGIWVLGDPGSFLFGDCVLTFALRDAHEPATAAISFDVDEVPVATTPAFELHQASSGGPAWNSPNHVGADGTVSLVRQGWQFEAGDSQKTTGLRATPIAALGSGPDTLAMAVPLFWQNFPKALSGTGRDLRLSLFPRGPALHELQGGERKTHVFAAAFGKDKVSQPALDWIRTPLVPSLPAEWYALADPSLMLPLDDVGSDGQATYDALVHCGVDGPDSFAVKAERIDEYGWRNYGDLFADHEAVGEAGRTVAISHYNNQYDAVAGFALQFMRGGDLRWRRLMVDLASHVCDIDIYHTTEDKAAFNGGLFWHTAHYIDAASSTHRSFPRLPGVAGGGPSNEHCYSHGLLLHHLMTGDERSRETVLGLARWVIDIDDGSKTVFRWLAGGATGLASSTADTTYHGPGRGAGNAILALLNADRLDPGGPWLAQAEVLLRRCIHPDDDIAGRDLLDAERRWSYTVFLQVLLRYQERKLELGQRDETLAYATASFLAYARWMRAHEYPYLDKPEILEFPNETWSAQDIRKAEVFYAAAALSTPAEADGFRERADFFFDHSVQALEASGTASLTRPMVLLLAQCLRARGARGTRDVRRRWTSIAPIDLASYRPPAAVRFEPQKVRAMRRARLLAVSLAVLGMIVVGAAVWMLLGGRA